MAPGLTDNTASSSISDLNSKRNPSLHVSPDHNVYLKDTDIPSPGQYEVLINVRCTGVCGSDLHLWHAGAIGPLKVDRDCILGHEAAGIVVLTGENVTTLSPGDRVAIEPGVPCDECWLCKAGKYNLCEAVKFAGVCPNDGSVRRYMVHPAKWCHKIPKSMSFSQAALLEPLSVVLHAIQLCRGTLEIGRPALVCGAGPIGLIALKCARASGAWPLVITDVDPERLKFAEKFVPGAKAYLVNPKNSLAQTSEEVRALYGTGPRDIEGGTFSEFEYRAPQTVLECTGIETSVCAACLCCRRSGTVMVIGVGKSTMHNLPFMHLSLAEIDLRFTNRYIDTWPSGINALEGNVVNLDELVTHVFPLEKAVEAMQTVSDPNKPTIKVHIVDEGEHDGNS